jgi:hypothetical protein
LRSGFEVGIYENPQALGLKKYYPMEEKAILLESMVT